TTSCMPKHLAAQTPLPLPSKSAPSLQCRTFPTRKRPARRNLSKSGFWHPTNRSASLFLNRSRKFRSLELPPNIIHGVKEFLGADAGGAKFADHHTSCAVS